MLNISVESEGQNNRSICYPQNSQIMYSPVNMMRGYSFVPTNNMRYSINGTPYEGTYYWKFNSSLIFSNLKSYSSI